MSGSVPNTLCTASSTARVSSSPQRGVKDHRAIARQRNSRTARSISAASKPAAYAAATRAPELVPDAIPGRMPRSASTCSTPTCAAPNAPPPPRASPNVSSTLTVVPAIVFCLIRFGESSGNEWKLSERGLSDSWVPADHPQRGVQAASVRRSRRSPEGRRRCVPRRRERIRGKRVPVSSWCRRTHLCRPRRQRRAFVDAMVPSHSRAVRLDAETRPVMGSSTW